MNKLWKCRLCGETKNHLKEASAKDITICKWCGGDYCEEEGHDWEYVSQERVDGLEDIGFEVECNNCGKKGTEWWVYSCVRDENGKEIK